MDVVVPPANQWQGGARYFRCDLSQTRGSAGDMASATGSFKDGMRGAQPLAQRWQKRLIDSAYIWRDSIEVACRSPHDTEYVGSVVVGHRPYPNEEMRAALFGAECDAKAAMHLGLTLAQ